jgi:hypothetical protein
MNFTSAAAVTTPDKATRIPWTTTPTRIRFSDIIHHRPSVF